MKSINVLCGTLISAIVGSGVTPAFAAYFQTNLVSNNPDFEPHILDPLVVNAWDLAIRPAGFGGHFWVTNTDSGTVTTYVGDVGGTPLFQDDLKFVTIPTSPNAPEGSAGAPTGQFFSPHPSDFEVTMFLDPDNPDLGTITGPGRFFAVEEGGTLSTWIEVPTDDGILRPVEYLVVADNSEFADQNTDDNPDNDNFAIYKGMAGTTLPEDNLLFAADFSIKSPGIDVWNKDFNDITSNFLFENPFGEEYAPFNIQNLDGNLYVAYAKLSDEPGEEQAKVGLGRLAEYDIEGNLLNIWGQDTDDPNENALNAPWGLAIAPDDFGEFSNALLVGNFGDGRIVGYDRTTREEIGFLMDESGNPIEIEGLWGLIFGNGASLGETNHLYFAAGPNDEADGLFGSLQVAQNKSTPEPTVSILGLLGVAGLTLARKGRRG
ncbi:MAG: TIGR03118 family protein [Okeania sp. SIO2C2]|uniref:TIGR03118 family protein n=1 Tax=Okeania sp. SIO2C2 TaxID=2607787 RepID=UPI0013B800BE|nr:TIGR03118 family protein [Okeania sp. SIO2C2]NEP85519.1 TIGR03118 family protein [Okeania sp. SIO2C2]